MPERLTVTPRQFLRLAQFTLGLLIVVIVTGAGVRLTRSGLGCPDWPQCHGSALPPLQINSVIEFTNRVLSGLVGLTGLGVFIAAFRRRPYRRDLMWIAATFPVGMLLGEATLGALTVEHKLDPGYVMAHFGLAMIVMIFSVALVWRARDDRPRLKGPLDGRLSLAVWSLVPLGAIVIFAGTVATAAGPHAGGQRNQPVNRLTFDGANTLRWAVHAHGHIALALGLIALGAWVAMRILDVGRELLWPMTVMVALLGVQGLIGHIQWDNHLPAGLVFVHVALAALTWLAILWTACAAGTPVLARAPRRGHAAASASP
jgi:cytochrome c oxidase assembly protein subunit 15